MLWFLSIIMLVLSHAAFGQSTTTSYTQQSGYYGTTWSSGGGIYNQSGVQIGQYANSSGSKQSVAWRQFKTDGVNAGSARALKVGDKFTIAASVTRAYGKIGFALLASPSSESSWADRENNYALSVNLDGPAYTGSGYGTWYIKYNGGSTSSASFGGNQTNYHDFVFTITLTAPDRANITITDNTSSTTSNFYDVQLNSSSPITDYAIFMQDDWDGGASRNAYWGLSGSSNESVVSTGALSIGSSNGSFSESVVIPNGVYADQTATSYTNALTKVGTGTLTLSGSNTYTGATTITGGKVEFGAANTTSTSSNLVLNGGALSTGASTGYSDQMNTLALTDNSTIALGTGSHTLTFANSSAVSWTAGKTLTITGWTGSTGTSGTAGKIFVGSGTGTLTSTQLSQITFSGFSAGAILLGTGEVVPVPVPVITSVTSSNSANNTGYTGSTITINGTNLGSATAVTIGGTSASITSNTSTQVVVTLGAGSSGTVSVTTGYGTGTFAGFTYLGYITNTNTDWNTGSTWLGGSVPPASAVTTVDNAITINAAVTNAPSSITINSGKSITFGSSGAVTATTVSNNGSIIMTSGGTLTIASGGTLTNNSTFTGGTGTVTFAGTGTVSGTVVFANVNIYGGVDFGSASTINTTLQIFTSGFVNINTPTYGSSSTLIYNTGATTYSRRLEWNATSGAGYPANVQIVSGASLDLGANSGTATARQIAGNLQLDGGLYMDFGANAMTAALTVLGNVTIGASGTLSLSTSSGGDIKLYGNWANSGTFNPHGRAVFFYGGNTTLTGATTFDYLVFNKTAATNTLTLSNDITVNQTLTLTQGIIDGRTNSKTVTLGTAGSTASASASSYINGKLAKTFSSGTSNPTFTFPIGDASTYTSTVLMATGTTTAQGTLSAITTNTDLTSPTGSGIDYSNSVNRYYTLSNSGTGGITTYAATFNYVSGDIDGSATPANFKVKYTDGTSWYATTISGVPNTTTTSVTAISSIGTDYKFIIGELACVPVTPSVSIAVTTGANPTCPSTSVTFTATPTNGGTPTYQWSKNATNVGTGATYTDAGTTAGSVSCVMTSSLTCVTTSTATSNTISLTIASPPTAYTVGGGGSYCSGGSGVPITLSNSTSGTNYQLKRGATNVGSPVAGTGSALTFSNQTTAGTYTVVATSAAGCTTTMTGSASVIVSSIPSTPTLTATSNPVCAGSSVSFVASGGSEYEFFIDGVSQGIPSGTNVLTTSTITNGQSVTVKSYSNLTFDGNISESTWGSALATSTGGPTPGFGAGHEINAIYAMGDGNNLNFAIAGNVQYGNRILLFIDSKSGGYTDGSFDKTNAPAGLNNFNASTTFDSGFSPDYCLVIGSNSAHTDNYFDLFTLSSSGSNIYLGNRTIWNSGAICGANPANSSQTQGFEVSIPKSLLGYTNGNNILVMAMYTAESGYLSNQFLTRANVSESDYGSGAITFGAAAPNPLTISSAVLNQDCYSTSSAVVEGVNATPTAYSVTGGGYYCSGGSGVAVGLSNSQTGVNYQLKDGTTDIGSPVAGTSSAISFGNQTTGTTYTVVATNATTGCISNMTGNAVVTVNPVPATPTLTASTATVCPGTPVTFTASGGSQYEFFVDGTSQGSASATDNFTTTTLTNGQVVSAKSYSPFTFDGDINESDWGSPISTSTGGPSSPGFGAGHEINAFYALSDYNNINMAIAGNVQSGNRILLFIDSKSGGYSDGSFDKTNAPAGLNNFNASTTFDGSFNPDYCLVIGVNGASDNYFDLFTLAANSTLGIDKYLGGRTTHYYGVAAGADPANSTQTQGFEFAIPKSLLGYTTGSIRVMAMYIAENGYLSNQFLTRADAAAGNFGSGAITFGGTNPGSFAIPSANLTDDCPASSNTISITLETTNTWTGAAGSSGTGYWDVPGNWSCGVVPTTSIDVVIPDTTTAPNQPVIRDQITYGIAVCKSININAGANLTTQANGLLKVNQ